MGHAASVSAPHTASYPNANPSDRPPAGLNAAPTANREVEVKFVLSTPALLGHLPDILRSVDLDVTPVGQKTVHDVYYDTPDWWLLRAGLACRVRRCDGAAVLEFKTVSPPREGIADRLEFCEPLPTPLPEGMNRLPEGKLKSWLGPVMPDLPLETKLDIVQERTEYETRAADGFRALASADRVRVNGQHEFAAIEMELREGARDRLLALSRELTARYGLAAEDGAKLERGFALAGIERPRPQARAQADLQPGDRFVDAAYKALRAELETFLWNEPGARVGLDAEYLHDMRVATRRLRAALRVFREALPPTRTDRFRRQLKRIASALGAVRDLDVQILSFDERRRAVTPPHRDALGPYRDLLLREREIARRKMIALLNTRRYAEFLSRFRRFLEAGPPLRARGPVAAQSVATVAPGIIRRVMKRVIKFGRSLTPASPDADLHALRIRCKRLRYAVEFFIGLYGEAAADFALRVKELQNILGEHQDAIVAQASLGRYAARARAPRKALRLTYLALGELIHQESLRAVEKRAAFFADWGLFDRKKTRKRLWKVMRALDLRFHADAAQS